MTWRGIAIAVTAAACMAPSVAVNAAHVLGHTPGPLAWPLAGAACMTVAMAGLSPFAMKWAAAEGKRGLFVGAALLWCVCVACNMIAAIGAASVARSDATGGREAEANRADIIQRQIAQAERQREAFARAAGDQPAAAIEGELATLRQDRRWTITRGCAGDQAADASRKFCADYARLQAAREAAAKAEAADGALAELRGKLLAATTADASQPADPKAASIARGLDILAGLQIDPATVGVAADWLFAIGLEALAALGPIVLEAVIEAAFGPSAPASVTPPAPMAFAAARGFMPLPAADAGRHADMATAIWTGVDMTGGGQDAAMAPGEMAIKPDTGADKMAGETAIGVDKMSGQDVRPSNEKTVADQQVPVVVRPVRKPAVLRLVKPADSDRTRAAKMRAAGQSVADIADKLGKSERTVRRWLADTDKGGQVAPGHAAGQ